MIVRYKKPAAKTLLRIQPKLAANFDARLEEIARDPEGQHPNVRQLVGREGFRLRVGDWRALFWIDYENDQLVVEAIEPRGQVYK